MRNVSDKTCRETQDAHFVFSNIFRKTCRLLDDVEKYCKLRQAADDNMAHAHFILETLIYRYIHSGCIKLIAFPLQQWSHGRASLLRYMYIACLVMFYFCLRPGFMAGTCAVISAR